MAPPAGGAITQCGDAQTQVVVLRRRARRRRRRRRLRRRLGALSELTLLRLCEPLVREAGTSALNFMAIVPLPLSLLTMERGYEAEMSRP